MTGATSFFIGVIAFPAFAANEPPKPGIYQQTEFTTAVPVVTGGECDNWGPANTEATPRIFTYPDPAQGGATERAPSIGPGFDFISATTGVYSGIDFAVPANLTINELNTLSTDYEFTAASCAIGSPRLGITLASNPNAAIFVYIGPPPNYTGCPLNVWANTGNLLTSASLVDATQYDGTFYESWASVQAQFSGQVVTDIFLVSDNGPAPGDSQTVLIDNTDVNGTLYDYEFTSKNDCKDGGWKNFTFPPGPFKNQGQCVSYFAQQ